MRLLWRLATRNWAARPGRTALSLGAITLGVALVVAVTSCYESLRLSLEAWIQTWLSRGQLRIEQQAPDDAGLDAALVARLRALPGVKFAAPRFRHYIDVRRPDATEEERRGTSCIAVDASVEQSVRGVKVTRGRWLTGAGPLAAVVAEELADELKVQIGDELIALDSYKRVHRLRVVGAFYQPQMGIKRNPQMLVEIATLLTLKPEYEQPRAHTIDLVLSEKANLDVVQRAVEAALPGGAVALTTPSQVRPIEEGMRLLGVILSWTSIGALITAWFIIFATLDLGVVERTRQLGLLRCAGASRGQVAGLVFLEAMPMALAGVGLGLPLGLGIARWAAAAFDGVFGSFHPSTSGLWYGAIGGLAATATAAALPAWAAARTSPIVATRPQARAVSRAWQLPLALAGAGLLGLLASQTWGRDSIGATRLTVLILLAWPAGLAATLGLLPLVISVVTWLVHRPLAFVLRVPHRLLSIQLQRAGWRSALTAGALAVSVSLVVNLLTNTESIIAGWELPRTFPDAMMWLPFGAPADKLEAARQVVPDVAPISVNDLYIPPASGDRPPEGVRLLGVDPARDRRMLKLRFIAGNAETAYAAMARGGDGTPGRPVPVIAPRAFVKRFGLGYGDEIKAYLTRVKTVRLMIVGVVESAGLDLAQNFYDTGGLFQSATRTALIGSQASTLAVFDKLIFKMVLFNFGLGPELDDAQRRLEQDRLISELETRIGFRGAFGAKVIRMAELKQLIDQDFRRSILWVVLAAGMACLVAGLGVVNLMMASVTSRAAQIAVLRGIGATRGLICRLVVAEGLLLGIAGCGGGLLLGLFMAALSNQIDRVAFAIEPKFVVPWPTVGVGLALALLIVLLASIPPAIHAARTRLASALAG